jgi:hypothetical protein
MNLQEDVIVPGTLEKIVALTGGQKGKPFILENTAGEKVVVKFQKENPADALAGSHILAKAEVRTPKIRLLKPDELPVLSAAVETLRDRFGTVVYAYAEAQRQFQHALVMDFVEGASTLKDLRKGTLIEFLTVICDAEFQRELGKIIAADAFAGNFDRMYALRAGNNVVGWYHEQNTLISNGKPVAIDNGFNPYVFDKIAPWGQYVGNAGFQTMSLASAEKGLAKIEAGALFDKFMESALSDHPDEHSHIDVAKGRKQAFIEQVSHTATETMKQLLKRGQHWKGQFTNQGIEEKVLGKFSRRKKILRMLAAGIAPDIAVSNTGDPAAEGYRKFVLVSELGLTDIEAEQILQKPIDEYKKLMAEYRARLAVVQVAAEPDSL